MGRLFTKLFWNSEKQFIALDRPQNLEPSAEAGFPGKLLSMWWPSTGLRHASKQVDLDCWLAWIFPCQNRAKRGSGDGGGKGQKRPWGSRPYTSSNMPKACISFQCFSGPDGTESEVNNQSVIPFLPSGLRTLPKFISDLLFPLVCFVRVRVHMYVSAWVCVGVRCWHWVSSSTTFHFICGSRLSYWTRPFWFC